MTLIKPPRLSQKEKSYNPISIYHYLAKKRLKASDSPQRDTKHFNTKKQPK